MEGYIGKHRVQISTIPPRDRLTTTYVGKHRKPVFTRKK